MKQLSFSMIIIFCVSIFLPTTAYANMAAPQESDKGSVITFDKNEEIAVRSEVLDIVVNGTQAEITATYTMQNTTNKGVTTHSMFISPNIELGGTQVLVDGEIVEFERESFHLNYSTEVTTEDWKYVVLTDQKIADIDENMVDTVTFELDFNSNEQYDVVVSYIYNLGGYPDYDYNAKCGEIYYHLVPAAMWKNFESLTINLTLDEDMPVITDSNLAFDKIGNGTYQYVSSELPTEDLKITIDEDWKQNIFSTLRNPYIGMMLKVFSPIIVSVLAIGMIIIVLRIRKSIKNKGN